MTSVSDATLNVALTANQVYTSSVCDLKGYNSLTAQVLLTWVEVVSPTTNIVFSFSPDNVNYDTNETFVITTGVGINLSMPIHSRFMKYVVSNPEATGMSVSRISATVHVAPHQNIDVNLGLDDSITVVGDFGLETTQLEVKGLLNDVKLNTTRVKTTDNVADAIPVRLVAGIGGEFYNPLRANGNDLSIYVDDMNPDVAVNSGLSTKALQEDMSDKLNELTTQSTTQISYLTSIDSKITEVNTGDVTVTSSVLPTGASTSALQTTGNDYIGGVVLQTTETNNKLATANATLDNIKLDTANLVRVAPTDNNVQQAIPVRLMVGSSGSAFNALRSIGSDLGVYVDDMNPDSVNNSGMAKASLQTDGNNTLTTISNTLTTMDGVLDNIETGINKVVTTDVLYNNATLTAGTTSSTINMGTGKDRYNTIQVIGSSVTNGFDFRFDFSIDGTNWYSDGVFSSHYHNGATYEFAVSRLNISAPYIRIHAGSTTGSNVYMSYALSKE